MLDAITDPGPFLSFSNGDSGVNNFMVDRDDGRIIDFEFAGFRHALTDAACIAYATMRLQRFPLMDGRRPGNDSRLQMVSTLEAAAEAAESHGALPHLRGWARTVASALRRRWPDADADFGSFREYTTRR